MPCMIPLDLCGQFPSLVLWYSAGAPVLGFSFISLRQDILLYSLCHSALRMCADNAKVTWVEISLVKLLDWTHHADLRGGIILLDKGANQRKSNERKGLANDI